MSISSVLRRVESPYGETGRLIVETRDFEPRLVVEETMVLLAEAAHIKGLEICSLVRSGVPRILGGDPGRLRQVLINLIGNAIESTRGGEIVVDVGPSTPFSGGASPGASGGVYPGRQRLRFIVRDVSTGLNPQSLERLFHLLSQADDATLPEGGPDPGLAICKRLVLLMDGQIGVTSTSAFGPEFWLDVSFERRTGPPPSDADLFPDLRELSVLIGDGSPARREVLEYHLFMLGMKVTSVEDARTASLALDVARRERTPFRLAILDRLLLRSLSEHQPLPAIPIIQMAPLAQLRADALRPGSGYLAKPIRPALLVQSITSVLGFKAAHPSPAATSVRAVSGRVLIVEDDLINQDLVAGMLERLGHHVALAATGDAAISELRQNPYDLVIMDCQMPDMDGFAATVSIRNLESAVRGGASPSGSLIATQSVGHIPVIALTASALDSDREKCLAAGMDGYLTKPVAIDDLAEAIRGFLG